MIGLVRTLAVPEASGQRFIRSGGPSGMRALVRSLVLALPLTVGAAADPAPDVRIVRGSDDRVSTDDVPGVNGSAMRARVLEPAPHADEAQAIRIPTTPTAPIPNAVRPARTWVDVLKARLGGTTGAPRNSTK